MDFHIDDSHTSIVPHNSNRLCIRVAHHSDGHIQRTDYQMFLADNYKRADGFDLRNELVVHMSRFRTRDDTHDSIDRKLRDPDNLRCTDNDREHMK